MLDTLIFVCILILSADGLTGASPKQGRRWEVQDDFSLAYAFRPIVPHVRKGRAIEVHYDQPITHYALQTNLSQDEAHRVLTADGLPSMDEDEGGLTGRLVAASGYGASYMGAFTLDEMHRLTVAFRRQGGMIYDRREEQAGR